MTRDQKWGKIWALLTQIYIQANPDKANGGIGIHQENFEKHPRQVFSFLFHNIHDECLMKRIPEIDLLMALAELSIDEFSNDPLGELYIHSFSVAMNESASVGKNIVKMRKAQSLSQLVLSEKIGCTQKDVSRWETGKRYPTAESLQKISDALGCKVDDLMN